MGGITNAAIISFMLLLVNVAIQIKGVEPLATFDCKLCINVNQEGAVINIVNITERVMYIFSFMFFIRNKESTKKEATINTNICAWNNK